MLQRPLASRREIGMYYHEGDNDDWYDESDYYDDEGCIT
jgi:hypothetical protein